MSLQIALIILLTQMSVYGNTSFIADADTEFDAVTDTSFTGPAEWFPYRSFYGDGINGSANIAFSVSGRDLYGPFSGQGHEIYGAFFGNDGSLVGENSGFISGDTYFCDIFPLMQACLDELYGANPETADLNGYEVSDDQIAPVINLTGANPQIIAVGSYYVELSATAHDNINGDITKSMNIDASAVNVNVPGSYSVSYFVSDTAGNSVTVTRMVTITANTPAPIIALTLSAITGDDKVYDGGRGATASGSVVLQGVLPGDDVTLEGTPIYTFTDAGVGQGIVITSTGYTLGGADSGNYTLESQRLTGNITAKPLTVSGISVEDKIYNRSDELTIVGNASLEGVVVGDTVTLEGTPIYTFTDAGVGQGIVITSTGYTLGGADSGNYTLESQRLTGNITAKPLTVSGISVEDKIYDGSVEATVVGNASLEGVVVGDTVTLAGTPRYKFSDKNVGQGIVITSTGYTLSGADAGNYTLTQPAGLSADITPAAITVTADDIIKTGGTSDPNLTYSITIGSLASGDSLTGELSRAVGEDFGDYPVSIGTLTANSSYTVTFVDAVFSIVENSTMLISGDVTSGSNTTDQSISVTFVSAEPTNDFVDSDVTATNGTLNEFSGSGTTYTATFTTSSDGLNTLQVDESAFTGATSGLGNIASTQFNWTTTYYAYSEVVEDITGNSNSTPATDIQINSLERVSGARYGVDYTARFIESSYVVSTAPEASEIQKVVDYVNLLLDIGDEANNGGQGIDFTADNLEIILNLDDVFADNMGEYNSYIDTNADLFSVIATLAEVQSMVHIVNVVEASKAAADGRTLSDGLLRNAGVAVNNDFATDLTNDELLAIAAAITAAVPAPATTAALQLITAASVTPVIILNGDATLSIGRGASYVELGATALDIEDVITNPAVVVGGDGVNTSTLGIYTITYTVTDAAGNVAIPLTRTVNVVDATATVITVAGDNPATVELGATYADAGATADGGQTVLTTGAVDTLAVGTYILTYTATDGSNNVGTATRIVNVVDTRAPVITLTGGNPATVDLGTTYTDAGAIADSGEAVTATGNVDTSVPGTYTLTYTATDASNNVGIATRTVTVVDARLPVISLLGEASMTLEVGDTFIDAGATATDNVDGDLSDEIVVTGSVDTAAVGTYVLAYNVSDTESNAAIEVTRTVTVEPILTLVVPEDLRVNAVGYLTGVNLDPEGVASATYGGGNVISAVADQEGPFQSGNHEIVWSATSAGKTITATQRLKVIPLVNLATGITTTEGNSVEIEMLLSGQAADYPVTIPFTVGGTAVEGEDYSIDQSGSITITEGIIGSITLSTIEDEVAESEETVVIALGVATNTVRGLAIEQVISIVEENLPPSTDIVLSQTRPDGGPGFGKKVVSGADAKSLQSSSSSVGDIVGPTFAQNFGTARVELRSFDANSSDSFTADFTRALSMLANSRVVEGCRSTNCPSALSPLIETWLEFDPIDIDLGSYSVPIDVSDATNTVTVFAVLNIIASAPVLTEEADSDGDGTSDAAEGFGDSDGDGIPDYSDNITETNIAPAGDGRFLQSEQGTTLMLGRFALGKENNGVLVKEDEIAEQTEGGDVEFEYPSDLIDFAVTGAEFGHGYKVVVSLPVPLPQGALYRKYSVSGGWADFVENATNTLSSAKAVEGACPELGSDAYTLGLTAGDDCLGLLIEEGGPNDADGVVNGTLVDPGGFAVQYFGPPSDLSEITLSRNQLTANGTDSVTITVTASDAAGRKLESMSVSASVAISGTVISAFVDEGNGVYTATLTVGNTSGSAAVVAVIDNTEVSVNVSSEAVTLSRVVVPPAAAALSGGGGCTIGSSGNNDSSLPLVLLGLGLLMLRRRGVTMFFRGRRVKSIKLFNL